jgi:hypothetical protein
MSSRRRRVEDDDDGEPAAHVCVCLCFSHGVAHAEFSGLIFTLRGSLVLVCHSDCMNAKRSLMRLKMTRPRQLVG